MIRQAAVLYPTSLYGSNAPTLFDRKPRFSYHTSTGGNPLSLHFYTSSIAMSTEVLGSAANTSRPEARWSFYDLLDDYKQVLETHPTAAAPVPTIEPTPTRRVSSEPPISEPLQVASATLARSGSADTVDRRVRFADDGLVRVRLFAPSQAAHHNDDATGVPIVEEEDDGADGDDEDGDVRLFVDVASVSIQ